MQCETYQINIQRYLDNDLNSEEEKQLLEHIEQCSSCKQEFEEFQALHNDLLQLPKVELERSCIDDILNKIDAEYVVQQDEAKEKVLFNYKKYITPFMAAAAVLLVFFVSKGFFSSELPYADQQPERMNSLAVQDMDDAEGEVSTFDSPELEIRIMGEGDINQFNQYGVDKTLLNPAMFESEDIRNAPAVIRNWVERSKEIFAGQSFAYNGKTYIYVSLGQRDNIEYEVTIEEVYEYDNQLYVYAKVQEPQINNRNTANKVYPDVLVSVTGEYLDVHFNEWQGAEIETWIPEIYGIESIPEFNEQSSDIIKIYSPKTNTSIHESIVIKGIARTFDGSVYYRVLTSQQEEIASGFIFAAKGAPDWGHFEQEIFIDLPYDIQAVEAFIEVFEVSLRDGGQLGTVQIPVTLESAEVNNATEVQNKHWVTYIVNDVDVETGKVYVEQYLVDSRSINAPTVLNLQGVPIIRDITQEKANTVARYAQLSDIKQNYEIGALITEDGKVKQIFLFE
ncbi:Gmad2 immunoglobulin-like domain-containing protein [Desulfuribacillus alkaliarsenatis]|uniref:Anti-sigma-W factor RsiW n=1 Tax=Desulfuribacillus alkaliarsenatis TaxID=766136 RepID=A0A1E5G5U2_9FIRM|nr:Gmad2 immunoglobulin-like domain-containing protein [Desulfuribacillus alkaliarsenatis]OEF98465.1 hypothetical protein BHF68_01965 [Desulfuribacillus alkaliarsenatis]